VIELHCGDVVEEISEICLEHQVNMFMGSVLYHSKTEQEEDNENLEKI
jgi:hypothetical protein